MDWSVVKAAYDTLRSRHPELTPDVETDLDTILAGTESDLDKARAYAKRLSTDLASAPDGHAFFNGKHFELDDVRPDGILVAVVRADRRLQEFLRSLQAEAQEHLQHIQFKVQGGCCVARLRRY